MKQAVRQVLLHHDALRLRFTRKGAGWQQFNSVTSDSPFEQVDLSGLAAAEQSAAIEEAAARAQASLDLAAGPLVRVVAFDLGAGQPSRLLFVIHHLTVDGVSWRILLDALERAYQQLSLGEPVALPPKTTSYKQWAEKLGERAQDEELAGELDYWLAELRADVQPLPVDQFAGRDENIVGSAHTLTFELSFEETRALLHDVPEVYHTQINEVLLTALAEAFRRWTGGRRVLVDVEGHGREAIVEEVDLSRTIGWFTAIYPVVLEVGALWQPGAELMSIKEKLRRVPNWGIGYGLLRYLSADDTIRQRLRELRQAEVSFNYLGQFDQVVSGSALYTPARESIGSPYSPQSRRTHLVAIYGSIAGGQFHLGVEYSSRFHRQETIERLGASYVAALREIILHCQSPDAGSHTPSDFPLAQVGQEELNQAFRLVDLED
jgi:non-ribosomal peptide synthase protein (TIGR01720 family)